jgi:hypothetical protein
LNVSHGKKKEKINKCEDKKRKKEEIKKKKKSKEKKRNQQASQYLSLAGRSQYRLAGTFHGGRSCLMKIVFFR